MRDHCRPEPSRPEPRPPAPAPGERGRALAALAAVQVLFGTHYPVGKLVVAEIPPAAWSLLRAAGAALVLAGLTRALRERFPSGWRTHVRFAGLGILGVAVNQWLFVEGLHRTSPGHSALINASIPVLVVAVAVLLGRERFQPVRLAGIAVTLAGVLLLLIPTGAARGAFVAGDLLTLGNGLSYSFFLVLGKPVLEREKTLPATALLLLYGALWLVPAGGWSLARFDLSAIGPVTWALGAWVIAGPTVGAYLLNTYALRRLDSSVVAFFIFLQPLIGAGLSIALGMDRLTPRFALAGAVIFAGVFLCLRPVRRAGRPVRHAEAGGDPPVSSAEGTGDSP